MKRKLSILLAFAMLFTTIGVNVNTASAAEPVKELKYHLDMGVYVTEAGDYGKATKPYTANLTFNENIDVKRVMTLAQAKAEGIDIWNTKNFSNNIPLGTYKDAKDSYTYKFDNWISTGIKDVKLVSNDGNKVKYTANALLSSKNPAGYNLVNIYNKFYESIPTVKSVVVVNNSLLETIKKLEAEKAELQEKVSKFTSAQGATAEQKKIYDRLNLVRKQLYALYKKPTATTINQVIQGYEFDIKGFVNEVFKFWGTKENLKTLNYNMYSMLDTMSKATTNKFSHDYYLVFLPMVIEYETKKPIVEEEIKLPKEVCDSTIFWIEKEWHLYFHDPGCYCPGHTDKDGNTTYCSGCRCDGHYCEHKYAYKATANTTANLVADKPNGGPKVFKSGYGFSVTMRNDITVELVGDNGICGDHFGNRKNKENPVPPTSAEVRTNWKVINKEKRLTQPSTIALAKDKSTLTTSTFVTAANPISHYNKKLIYTDVALKGTKEKPVTHKIYVYGYGGGIQGMPFCTNVPLTFKINGDMYEDDSTADNNK